MSCRIELLECCELFSDNACMYAVMSAWDCVKKTLLILRIDDK